MPNGPGSPLERGGSLRFRLAHQSPELAFAQTPGLYKGGSQISLDTSVVSKLKENPTH